VHPALFRRGRELRPERSVARVAWCDSDATMRQMRQEGAVAELPFMSVRVAAIGLNAASCAFSAHVRFVALQVGH
jgi:hypothetical protein